ncbi:hypothetical protein HZS_971 [Henneguya salminicola]|nr:hypothetical protein HZS_971 [Henneguya salminicola]
MLKLHAKLTCGILRRHLSIHLYFFLSELTINWIAAFKVADNQHYTEILKQQDQSLRYLR